MLDLANEHRLRTSITLRQLFELQDVAVCEGDMRWQQSQFRQETLAGRSAAGARTLPGESVDDERTPAQETNRERLLGGLSGLEPGSFRQAAALTRQAANAGITFEEAAAANQERARTRTAVRVGRGARPRSTPTESGANDG